MNYGKRMRALAMMICLGWLAAKASAQALPTASGPGPYISLGAGVSAIQADYGQRILGGGMLFSDMHVTARYGIEAEARWLDKHTDEGVTERTLLVGPHVYLFKHGPFKAYGKFLVGQAHMTFPFGYAKGNYLALVPGAGLDVKLTPRIELRALDFEYQDWRNFTFGPMHPYGISAGISFRLTHVFRRDPYVY